jgi:hypothetical protein
MYATCCLGIGRDPLCVGFSFEQAGVLPMTRSAEFNTSASWRAAFREEWLRLAEGRADLRELDDWAIELYPTHWRRHPAEVAGEEWHGSTAAVQARRASKGQPRMQTFPQWVASRVCGIRSTTYGARDAQVR